MPPAQDGDGSEDGISPEAYKYINNIVNRLYSKKSSIIIENKPVLGGNIIVVALREHGMPEERLFFWNKGKLSQHFASSDGLV